jgi:translation elongation factor P/translation initiation factor 5A
MDSNETFFEKGYNIVTGDVFSLDGARTWHTAMTDAKYLVVDIDDLRMKVVDEHGNDVVFNDNTLVHLPLKHS